MSNINSIERWRSVVGYESFYEVSDMGRVRSLPRLDRLGRPRVGRMLSCYIDEKGSGYRCVNLSKDGVAKKTTVHTIVLEAFVGPRPSPSHEGCHGDGVRHNPALGNLSWGTPQKNWEDKWRHGTATAGANSVVSILTPEMVQWIRESAQTSVALAPVLGVASSTIRAVRLRQNWAHQK